MSTELLLDIDSTITPPRLPITEDMVKILKQIKIPFHVAAGSDMDLLSDQFFNPLYAFGFRKSFDAFISNGAIHYHCNFAKSKSIEKLREFNIKKHLGSSDYLFLTDTLKQTLKIPEFRLPDHLKVHSKRITYRVSMVNFTPIGRVREEGSIIRDNRKNFVNFDKDNDFRRRVIKHLESKLERLIKNKDLKITLGGQTSFDIGIFGQDKTIAVKTLIAKGLSRLIFIGDSLYKGGNDEAIKEYIDNQGLKNAEYYQVDSYHDTIQKLKELDFI